MTQPVTNKMGLTLSVPFTIFFSPLVKFGYNHHSNHDIYLRTTRDVSEVNSSLLENPPQEEVSSCENGKFLVSVQNHFRELHIRLNDLTKKVHKRHRDISLVTRLLVGLLPEYLS